jgi:polyisoprenyl-teichoic acid--peptidoglycan teichoic acid transferase
MDKNNRIRRRRKSRLRRIIFGLLIAAFSALFYFGYVVYNAYDAASNSYEELERGDKSKLRTEKVEVKKDPFSILLMGIEDYSSGGHNGRTDSLMVATLDPKNQTVKLLSIPRDTLVKIPNKVERDKINHAYAFGGKEATIESVENLLEIPIDYYVTVGFDGFKDIIDEIGGVSVDVPFDFWETSDKGGDKIYFYEGPMKLNGEEALAYARMRKRDPRGDFGRNDRQKEIIESAIKQILSPANLLKIDDIAQHIGSNVQTNLQVTKGLGVQQSFRDFKMSNLEKLSLPGEDVYYDGIYYFEPDEIEMENIKTQLKNHLNHTN